MKKKLPLHNQIDKKILKEKLQLDNTKRITLSFYKYVFIENPKELRDFLYKNWIDCDILGRIYLAEEGINAQLSVPESQLFYFNQSLKQDKRFSDIYIKQGIEDNGRSFYKLKIKVKKKIVADNLLEKEFQMKDYKSDYLSAQSFNGLIDDPKVIVVDVRNHYETEVGKFKNAISFDIDTFREIFCFIDKKLAPYKKENKQLLLYCTGGIRCEKVGAYLRYKDFKNVKQLYGGIIEYARFIKEKKMTSKFVGKNFVFDERMGERITQKIISHCHQCAVLCDRHVNCCNDDCHLLFIQCVDCEKKNQGCCSKNCIDIINLPLEIQRQCRKGKRKENSLSVYKSRLRPKLKILSS